MLLILITYEFRVTARRQIVDFVSQK